jgi:hypothetical protein
MRRNGQETQEASAEHPGSPARRDNPNAMKTPTTSKPETAAPGLVQPDGYAQPVKPDLYERDQNNYFHEPCDTCKHRHSVLDGHGAICRGCSHYCA